MPIDTRWRMQEQIVCSIAAATKYENTRQCLAGRCRRTAGRGGGSAIAATAATTWGRCGSTRTTYASWRSTGSPTRSGGGCYPFALAAWRLRKRIEYDTGDLWTRAANYHSRTPQFLVYRADLMVRARWADWLGKLSGCDLALGRRGEPGRNSRRGAAGAPTCASQHAIARSNTSHAA